MRPIPSLSLTCRILAVMLLAGSTMAQQAATDVAAGPVPRRIIGAKTIFISNTLGDYAPDRDFGDYGPYRAYNQFYAAIKNWGHYELASDPADVDVVFEIRFADPPVGLNVSGGSGITAYDPQFQLAIVDPKTRISLWWLVEHIQRASGKKGEANYNLAMSNLVADVKKLVSQAGTGPNSK